MEMMIIKFRTNDLHSSLGKQIEFNPTVIKDFFKFTEDIENTTFVYKSNIENDPLTNTSIKVILKKSPARGDYKVYQNEDGSLFLKNFLLQNLNLTEDNIDDYLTIRKRNKSNYDFTYIKADSEIGKFFKLHSLGTDGGSIIHDDTKQFTDLNYTPCNDKIKSYNRIIFGAPGTGKSFQLKDESQPSTEPYPFESIERVTFHPDYSYGQFVGSYKPVSDDNGKINYEYVPGPFMRTLVAALESGKNGDSANKYLLIVEEINRAKVAAVFGDMFQLLDRTDAGDSVYEIQASEDVRRYLAKELGGTKDNYTSIKLPNNMYIWATMNSADQGVFPMDTAFKRRWDFTYLGIDKNEEKITIEELPIINEENETIKWNTLRKSINTMLLKECKVNEDKLLGPFFISGEVFRNATSNKDVFFDAFNSKVLMYLFEDAGKMHQKKLFAGIDQSELTFSKVCEEFKNRGTAIFGNAFKLVE